ncbi:MAG: hypothetical protein V7641_2893 [Blastocatellia bacterium]
MNSQRARNYIVSTALVVAVLFFHSSLFAQLLVTVKTPGTNFSVVGTKGTAENVAGGRRFRAPAFADLKIRGALRVPQSASGVSKTQLMQQLAIHFRTSPSGPSLRSVELLNGSHREFLIPTNLTGDYTARETSKPEAIANMWKWTSPIKVDSQSVIVLEIQFPGGFDSKVNPGEFVLTSVDAQFQGELNSNFNDRKPPVLGAPVGTTLVTSIWPNGKAYFFEGSQYVRYDAKADKADQGYPVPIAGNWPGFPPAFQEGVDAEVVWNRQKVYFFKGDQYLRYDIAADRVDPGYPLPIAGHWPGLWTDHIDAGVVWPNGKAYFFRGSQYIRYDIAKDKADPGYPADIKGGWPGFPSSFAAGVDDAVVWNNGKAYFFKGSEYIRYDIAADKTDPGYPQPIAENWRGLGQ